MEGKLLKFNKDSANHCEINFQQKKRHLAKKRIIALQDLQLKKKNLIQKRTEILDNLMNEIKFDSANPSYTELVV